VITVIIFIFLIPNPLNKPGTAVYKIKDRVSITRITRDPSLKRRIATWKFTILMIKDRPWLGSGIGTYKYNTLRYQARFFSEGENRTLYPHGFADKAHNEYLQLWAELGLVGLVIFFWLIYTYFRFGLRTLRDITDNKDIEDKVKFTRQGPIIGLMGAVVAFLVDAFFGFPMHLPASAMLFWLVLSLTVVSGYGLSRDYAISETLGLKEGRYLSREVSKIKKINAEPSKNKATDNTQIVKAKVLKYVFYIWVLILAIMFSFNIVKPFMAQIYWFYADREKNRGDSGINETIQNYRLALKWDPFLGEVYYDIGSILLKEGLPTPALDYFLKAEKYTDLPGLPLVIARVYADKDMPAEAATKLKQAITYEGSKRAMLPLYNELGNMYLTLTKPKLAELAFKDALKINGGSGDDILSSHFGLARAYLNQGLHDQAIKEFNKVTELAPNSLEAKYAQKAIEQLTQIDENVENDSGNDNGHENNL
ncbi:MAG TPA: O-antigen ligase family protein, partial [Atribacterota bacterium]|nr:O-antigen ligase family protein [Atribacterota bacterium]